MTTNTLHITVEPTAAFFEAALEDVRQIEADQERDGENDDGENDDGENDDGENVDGENVDGEYVLSLPDEAALERVLSAKNLELVRTIATEEPDSVRELARLVDRDIKNVSTSVNELAELGLVDLEASGRAKTPTVWYDHVEIDIRVKPDDPDDSDVALA